jgi:hypothetical protein
MMVRGRHPSSVCRPGYAGLAATEQSRTALELREQPTREYADLFVVVLKLLPTAYSSVPGSFITTDAP